jgi:hypothetical protein
MEWPQTVRICLAFALLAVPADAQASASSANEKQDQRGPKEYAQPMRAAYVRPRPVRPPRAEAANRDASDEPPRLEEEMNEFSQFEGTGAKPTLKGSTGLRWHLDSGDTSGYVVCYPAGM